MTTQADFLFLLLSQNAFEHEKLSQQRAIQEELDRLATENAKLRAAQRAANPPVKRGKRAPIHSKPLSAVALGFPLPDKGSLDAPAFVLAMRNAGRRINQDGHPYTNQAEVRGDLIKAIAGFIGYDARLDFGQQETAARTAAQRQITGKVAAGPDRVSVKSAERSLSGYIAGVPNSSDKHLNNLLAQAHRHTDDLLEYQRTGNAAAEAIEQERLAHIYQQIRAMGVTL